MLQLKLDLPLNGFDDRDAWLSKYEEKIDSLEELKKQFLNQLKK